MTEETKKPESDAAVAADKANQIWGDLVPVVGFIGVYNGIRLLGIDTPMINSDTALYWATGLLIILTLGAIGQKLMKGQPIPLFMIFTSGIVGGFGLLGILLQEKSFIYIKPTIQQLFLASLIFGSLAIGRNIWQVMFKTVFNLPQHAWNVLAARWAGFFVVMAIWNEFLWRTYVPGFASPLEWMGLTIAPAGTYEFLGLTFGAKDAEGVWANWKLGNMVITFIFGAANVPFTMKHLREAEMSVASETTKDADV